MFFEICKLFLFLISRYSILILYFFSNSFFFIKINFFEFAFFENLFLNEIRLLDIFPALIKLFLFKSKFLEDKSNLFLSLIVLQAIIFDLKLFLAKQLEIKIN